MIRDITVEVVYDGVRYMRMIRTEVNSVMDKLLKQINSAAQELRQDLAAVEEQKEGHASKRK